MQFGKVWGSTKPLLVTPLIEVHEILVKPGTQCSLHKHEHKWNAFYVISGGLEIHVKKNDYDLVDITSLTASGFTTVKPGEFHKFVCSNKLIGLTRALEIYYLSPITEDIIRETVGGQIKNNDG